MTRARTETCPDCGDTIEVRELAVGPKVIEKRVCRGCLRSREMELAGESGLDWRATSQGGDVARRLHDWVSHRLAEINGGHVEVASSELRRGWEADLDTTVIPEVERRKIQMAAALAYEALRGPGSRPALAIAELEAIRALVSDPRRM